MNEKKKQKMDRRARVAAGKLKDKEKDPRQSKKELRLRTSKMPRRHKCGCCWVHNGALWRRTVICVGHHKAMKKAKKKEKTISAKAAKKILKGKK